MRRPTHLILLTLVALLALTAGSPAEETGRLYRSPADIAAWAGQFARQHGDLARLHTLGASPGKRPLSLLELGDRKDEAPAILVVANMEGDAPLASEAACSLADLLVGDWSEELRLRTWFIVPLGNPDGYQHFFARPLAQSFLNDRPFNADNDNATDEDGPDDLNKDGYVTMMRQKHPEGRWLPVEGNPVLMKKAEAAKGEQGIYRLISEGIDNDGDGEINEDGPGGANPGHNFPHNFRHYTEAGGRWAASEPESRALLEFAFDHPEIAMVITLGRSNSLVSVPEGSKKAESAGGRYKIPKRFAEGMGVSPDERFPLSEIVEMARDYTGYQELTEDMVLQYLGVGAAVNPNKKDVPYWTEVSERYNEYLKEKQPEGKRLDPPDFSPGSIEEWAYYQFGVPSFSLSFWELPETEEEASKEEGSLTPDDLEKMSNDEFIALGKEKIAAFLKANDAPPQYSADMVIMGLKGGMMDTKKMAEFIRKGKKKEEAGGADETEQALYDYRPESFVEWQSYSHPTLGDVEIGGMIPYADIAPPASLSDSLIAVRLPFLRQLAGFLPVLKLAKVELSKRAADVWKVDAWVTNEGLLPCPTHQGHRSQRPSPVVVTLAGKDVTLLEGRARQTVDVLEGSGGTEKVSWLVQGREGEGISLSASSFAAGKAELQMELKEGGR